MFQRYSYSFLFVQPADPQAALSAALGAMTETVTCECDFDWHYAVKTKTLNAKLEDFIVFVKEL